MKKFDIRDSRVGCVYLNEFARFNIPFLAGTSNLYIRTAPWKPIISTYMIYEATPE